MNHWNLYMQARMACIKEALNEGKSVSEITVMFGLDPMQAKMLCKHAEGLETPKAPKQEIQIINNKGNVIMTFSDRSLYESWFARMVKEGRMVLDYWRKPMLSISSTFET